MRFTVQWTATAEQDLAAIWLGAIDRDAVTTSSHAIDLILQEDADAVGQPLYDTVRCVGRTANRR